MGNSNLLHYNDDDSIHNKKLQEERINNGVCKALTIFGIFLWILLGIILGVLISLVLSKQAVETHPANHVYVDSVATGNNYITIGINNSDKGLFYSASKGTSMYPSLWTDSFEIYMIPNSTNELKVGDVIAYKIDGMKTGIVHRIVDIGQDEKGFYVRTKGDNNPWKDEWKIRSNEIQGLLIGVLY